MEILKKYRFLSSVAFFKKNADVSNFGEIQG